MPDYPPGYDPSQAALIRPEDQAIGGLIGLSAFAVISVGAFFAVEAAIAGTATEGFTINGVTWYTATLEQAQALAALGEGTITIEAANTLMEAAILKGGALDAAALVALDAYQPPRVVPPGSSAYYFGPPGSGGVPVIPGFPGFPAGPPHGLPGFIPTWSGGWVCVWVEVSERGGEQIRICWLQT